MWTLSFPVKEDCLIAPDVYTHITDDMQRTITANINHCTGKAAPQEDASQPGQETDPAMAEKPRMTDSKPYVGRSASPAPATSLKSTNISLRTLFFQMARRQETRPQCLRTYLRGVRGESEGKDCGFKAVDESGRR